MINARTTFKGRKQIKLTHVRKRGRECMCSQITRENLTLRRKIDRDTDRDINIDREV